MNVNIFLLAVICVAAARPNQKSDGVDGIRYQVPEYVDPELEMLKLSVLPLLTFLEMGAEPEDSLIQGDATSSEQIDYVKNRLEDVMSRLEIARYKLEQGDKQIFADIEKSINTLKNLQRYVQRDSFPVRVSLRKSVDLTGKLNDLITDKEESKTTQSIIGSDDMITVYPLPDTKLEISDIGESVPCMQNPNCTDKPQPENPPPPEILFKIPLDNPTIMTETKKYEDAGKAIFRKKWTWKSSSIV